MKRKTAKKAPDAVLSHVAVSRRKFTKKLVGAAFAMPTMMSFALDEVAFGATGHQSTGGFRVFPTFLTSTQIGRSCAVMRYYCVPEDPARRIFTPIGGFTVLPSVFPSL